MSIDKVEILQDKLTDIAKSDPKRSFYSLRDKISPGLGGIGTTLLASSRTNMGSLPGHVLQSLRMSYIGNAAEEPYEGKPHVRFNEGPVETQFGWALPVYSTRLNMI